MPKKRPKAKRCSPTARAFQGSLATRILALAMPSSM